MISFDNLSPFKQSQSSWFYLEKVSKFHLHFDSCIPVVLCLRLINQTAIVKTCCALSKGMRSQSTRAKHKPGAQYKPTLVSIGNSRNEPIREIECEDERPSCKDIKFMARNDIVCKFNHPVLTRRGFLKSLHMFCRHCKPAMGEGG